MSRFSKSNNKLLIVIKTNKNRTLTIGQRYHEFDKVKQHRSSISSSSHTTTSTENSSGTAAALSRHHPPPAPTPVLIEVSEFSNRINRLRFIDDSASSTALTSPAESLLHLNYLHHHNNQNPHKMKQNNKHHHNQQQHKYLLSNTATTTSTSSSRTISLPASSQSCSASSTPQIGGYSSNRCNNTRVMAMMNGPTITGSSIQRQPNVKSSTDTLCSESGASDKSSPTKQKQSQLSSSVKAPVHQHEQLGMVMVRQQAQGAHICLNDFENADDEEIKSIISSTNNKNTDVQASRYLMSNGYKIYFYKALIKI